MSTDPQVPRSDAATRQTRAGAQPPAETARPLDGTQGAGSVGPALTLAPGMKPVAGYKLVRALGRGAFGEVWQATGPGGFPVAMKFLRLADRGADSEKRALKLMQGLRHPNLLALHGAWRNGDCLIVAMELADRTLHDRLVEAIDQGKRGIPQAELLGYMRQAAAGLDYLNGEGVQHRDVKPANLLLVGGGVKVGDFGLAKLLEKTIASVSNAMTPSYAAPEFVNGQATRWSDQYSLAVAYCQMRGGRLPFEGNLAAVLAGHLMKAPDLEMLPAAERRAVARALAKKPEQRWPNCAAFVEALAGGTTRPAPVPRVRPAKAPARRSYWPAATVAVTLLAAVLLGLLILQFSRQPGTPHVPDEDGRAGTDRNPSDKGVPDPEKKVRPLQGEKRPPALPPEIKNSIDMKLVLIPAGKFRMGSAAAEEGRGTDEEEHEVRITKPFYMGVYEVTQVQYRKVMDKNPSYFSAEGGGKEKVTGLDTGDFPVETVSWEDAVEFCKRLSALAAEQKAERVYHLPTEAEWEYTCRGGPVSSTPFHFGNSLSSAQANFNGEYPYGGAAKGRYLGRTEKVGSYPANRFGLYDMHGNTWEWCADWYDKDYYRNSPIEDPQGPKSSSESCRVLRGGSWVNSGFDCRTAQRSWLDPGNRYNYIGFRVVVRLGVRTP